MERNDGDNALKLSDFNRDPKIVILSSMAIVIGIAGAGVAYGLLWLIAVITNISFYGRFSSTLQSPVHNHLGMLLVLVPVIGGLIVGLMARFGSDRIRGHGIPEALEAILFGRGRMEPKVAVLKPLSSAISIGTGGPFGAEGPIIMTGGAIGSLFGQLFRLSSSERRTLLAAGAAGGMSAVFATPIAAVLLAVELLLFEWRPRSVIPVTLAALTAFAFRISLLGRGPMFLMTSPVKLDPGIMIFAVAVGLIAGLCAYLVTAMVYACEDLYSRLPIHWMWWPALGAVVVGIGGIVDPRVLGVGYDSIGELLHGNIIGAALIALLVGKMLVWSISLGSGTSGGVLAPLLLIGGALGGIEAGLIPVGDSGLWALVSMAAVMGGTMRVPLTASIFALELTWNIGALPLLLAGSAVAYGVTVLTMPRSILTEKVARRGYHIFREYAVDPFSNVRVEEVMQRNVDCLAATMKLSELSDAISKHDPTIAGHHAFPLVDGDGLLVGIITQNDILRALANTTVDGKTVLDAGSRNLIVTFPNETVLEAAQKMLGSGIGRLPVVNREDPKKLVGYVGRGDLMRARMRQLEEDRVRERGLKKSADSSQAVGNHTSQPLRSHGS